MRQRPRTKPPRVTGLAIPVLGLVADAIGEVSEHGPEIGALHFTVTVVVETGGQGLDLGLKIRANGALDGIESLLKEAFHRLHTLDHGLLSRIHAVHVGLGGGSEEQIAYFAEVLGILIGVGNDHGVRSGLWGLSILGQGPEGLLGRFG